MSGLVWGRAGRASTGIKFARESEAHGAMSRTYRAWPVRPGAAPAMRTPILTTVDEVEDASARTRLANERTQLAWWRTGLTAIAVGLAVGRIVPELSPGSSQLPYSVIGAAFVLYGLALMLYGSARARQIESSLRRGRMLPLSDWPLTALTGAGAGLAIATVALIVFA